VLGFLALAAAALAPAAANPSIAGMYVVHQMEMGGALELQKSGHFRYALDYGAVSEASEGDWTFDGSTVHLTSNPMPKQPDFIVERDDAAPPGELYVAVDNPDMSWSPLTVEVTVEGFAKPVEVYAEDDGRVDPPNGHRITAVKMLMPVYETGGEPVQLTADRGHRLLFKPQMNDVGQAPLRDVPLVVKGSTLLMHRYDAEIVFRRER
jgi:hypothetical protein